MLSPRKDFLLKEKDVFETRNTRHRPTARYRFGLDSAGEEDVPSDVHFDLFDARKWIHVAARRDTENWAVRKIPSLFGEREKGIHSFGNWTPARRKEISLPLNLRGTERDSLVSAKLPSPPSFSLFPPSLSRSLRLSSESNEPLAGSENLIRPDVIRREFDIFLKINSTYMSRLFLPKSNPSRNKDPRIFSSLPTIRNVVMESKLAGGEGV